MGLGFVDVRPTQKLSITPADDLPEVVRTLAKERENARLAKDFNKADDLRGQIYTLGYDVTDTSEGQKLTPHS